GKGMEAVEPGDGGFLLARPDPAILARAQRPADAIIGIIDRMGDRVTAGGQVGKVGKEPAVLPGSRETARHAFALRGLSPEEQIAPGGGGQADAFFAGSAALVGPDAMLDERALLRVGQGVPPLRPAY